MNQIRISQSVTERIYEIRVEKIMSTDIARVTPNTMMSELKDAIKENNYACIPVLNGEKLVGQISIAEYVDWLTSDRGDVPIEELMNTEYKSLHIEEPVITAIRELDLSGLRGLSVVEQSTEKFLGLICRCTMMEGVLAELDISDKTEKTERKVDCFFNNIESDSAVLTLNYNVEAKSLEYGGEVSSSIRADLYKLGLPGSIVRRAAIAAYEAEMNLLSYAGGGVFTLILKKDSLNMKIEDNGPGIPDIEKAMEPGYSTAPDWVRELGFGAGMGLQNIKNCSDKFRISSKVGEGTLLVIDINMEEKCA
ncbi:MAG: CBS domain-containing protein [Spirochaetales bacterium]|nr:CBS domain-containing protein [Spirochaetales bacterium]